MLEMFIVAVLFVGTHLGISSTGLRDRIVASRGLQAYLGIYSLLAILTLAAMIWVYSQSARFEYFWLPDVGLYWIPKIAMVVAFILIAGSFMTPNPTMVGMEGVLKETNDAAVGVLRLTRHPFQWGAVLWAVSHVAANGDRVSVVFFTAFAVLSFFGTFLMDRKKAKSLGDGWTAYAKVTSNVPFAAVFGGRNRIVLKELLLPTVAGIALYIAVFWLHEWIGGVAIFL
ncbi:MAG: NnrU family protein [Proteobacteria bacterium]|nr:NnrU family protein [Pseudomonadota bacterium]